MNRYCLFACLCLLAAAQTTACQCPGVFPAISSGYGADGPDSVVVDSVAGTIFSYDKFYFFRPFVASRSFPLIYFLPGMGKGGNDLVTYERLLHHMASRGYCVVLLTYRMISFPYQGMTYRRMFRGIRRAARACAAYADTTRLGMMGHSFGASSIPSHLYRALTKQKWGSNGAFMYLMAPHFVFGITQDGLRHFPPHVKCIAEVFQDDDCNDHRMAKDLFETVGISATEKNFIVLLSDSNPDARCRLCADHSTPNNFDKGKDVTDALDYYGIYRYFDALAEYAFTGSAAAKEIALGNGVPSQRFMGTWPDGAPVREAIVSESAPLVRPRSFYYFHWMHPWNVRRKKYHLSMPDGPTIAP
jgi:hypothetical protein